jgi:uroporphyrinogen-III synthase
MRAPASKRRKIAKPQRLRGRRILITRAHSQAGKLSIGLRAQGATVISIPSIEIRPPRSWKPLDAALTHLQDYDWLILTSVNGVEALFARLKHLRTRKIPGHLKIAAIGPATKAAAEAHCVRVQVVPKQYVAEGVVKALRAKVKGKKILLVRARVARDVIPADLRGGGAQVDVVEAYETVVPSHSRKALRTVLKNSKQRPHAITFTSSSTARNFLKLLGGVRNRKLLDGILLASIGPVTSATLREIGLRADIEAAEYTIPGLVRALVAAARSGKL